MTLALRFTVIAKIFGLLIALSFILSCENDVQLETDAPKTASITQEFDLIREKVDPAHRQAIYEKAKDLRAKKTQLGKEIEAFNLQLAEARSGTADLAVMERVAENLINLREQKEALEQVAQELDQQLDQISEAAAEVATLKGE
ncbi:MAG: hypothetical protein CMQ27_07835 [Gammaproteobacteria bacterium]|nr:hypothetical protein [Gammaproteobacteria bacterium]